MHRKKTLVQKIVANAAARGITNPDGTPVTAAQVENAMRAANNAQFGETAVTGAMVPLNANTPASAIYDKTGMKLTSDGAGHNSLVQDPSMLSTPSQALQNLIVQGTGGANSPYSWGSPSSGATTSGALANPVAAEDSNPRFYPCASTECLLYGANRNSTNPQNMAEDKNFNNKLLAGGLILGAPLALYAGAPALTAMATTAQTVPLAGGLAGVTGAKWITTILGGSAIGAFSNYIFDPDASPASMAVAGAGGALGGATKFGLNATFGLANQWVPTTLANVGTAVTGSQVVGRGVKAGLNQTGDSTSGASWWTSPLTPCGPVYPRTARK
jgi:hypothetical protein